MSALNQQYLSEVSVMVVDDSRSFLAGLKAIMEQYVKKILPFTSAKAALAQLELLKPDILLTDLEMPELNGLEFISQVREMPFLKAMPILVMTGNEDSEVMIRSIHVGADAFISKQTVRECLLPQLVSLARLKSIYEHSMRGKQLEAVKALIGTYKHEFGNSITAIDGKIRKLEKISPELKEHEDLNSIKKWLEKMVETLRKLDHLRHYNEEHYVGSAQTVKTE